MAPTRRALAAAGALLAAAPLAACGGHPSVPAPSPTGAAARACASFISALPSRLADEDLRSRSKTQAFYGDPAIVVSCGVGTPPGFHAGAECQLANGVGWYLSPDKAYSDQSLDVTVTAAGFRPRVSAFIPAQYRPNAVEGVIGELARPVKRRFHKTTGCV